MFRVLQRVVASSKCRRMAFSPASSCTMKREINFKLLGRANAVPFQCESLRTKRSVPSSHGKSSVSSLEIYVMCNIRVSDEGRGATSSAVAPAASPDSSHSCCACFNFTAETFSCALRPRLYIIRPLNYVSKKLSVAMTSRCFSLLPSAAVNGCKRALNAVLGAASVA